VVRQDPVVNDELIGRAFRAIRVRRHRRQADVAERAGVSRWTVARIEHGQLEDVSLATLRSVARSLEISVEIALRWRGAELDRVLGAGHDALREVVVRRLGDAGGWDVASEVTFSIWGERGSIDLLAWHAATRLLMVVEIKSEIVEVGRLVAQVERYRRLARDIAGERGWHPAHVAAWVVVADTRTNRRRLAAHRGVLRIAFPDDGRRLRVWLGSPDGTVSALTFLTNERAAHLTLASDRHRRVRNVAATPGRPGEPKPS
jgi:transcriptional regulator with XRE-family HTH domain